LRTPPVPLEAEENAGQLCRKPIQNHENIIPHSRHEVA
jgi:hypothetical protein